MNKFILMKDHVYNFIAEKITDGTFMPDQKVNEQLICEELGISRTPVREALIQLAADGYLDNMPHKGFIIKKLNEKKAVELYVIIGTLDGLAATLAMEHIGAAELSNMAYLVSAMDLSLKNNMTDAYFKQQLEFHAVYINACGNEELIKLMDMLKKSFLRHKYLNSENIIQILKDTNAEHQRIVELFEQKDPVALDHYLRTVHWSFDKAVFDSL